MADSRKAEVNFSDFEAVDFSDSDLVLDGDSEAFAKWYLEKQSHLLRWMTSKKTPEPRCTRTVVFYAHFYEKDSRRTTWN